MDFDGGVMITASHNPKEYNGFKIVRKNAMPFDPDDLNVIKKIIQNTKFVSQEKKAFLIAKNALKIDLLKEYIDQIIDFSHLSEIKPLKVIADTSNGMAGIVIPELARRLPIKLDCIFSELDGSFPNHNPNPVIPENTRFLQDKIIAEKADFGIAFDGDADRVAFIDERGERIDPDLIAAAIIHYYFKRGGKILCTAVSSRIVKDEAMDSGNEVIVERVGHTFIRKKMKEENVVFACESSGHYYFSDSHYIESPFLVFLKILEILSKIKVPLSTLISQFQRFCQERIVFPFSDVNKANFCLKKIETEYKKILRYGRIGNFSYVDGLSVEYPDWWFNLRISNTEPLMRLTIEADSVELLKEKKQELFKLIPF
jgi:phosphomannomutase